MPTPSEHSRLNNICMVILTIIAITGALYYTKPVMVPFVLALFIYNSATPLVGWLEKKFKFPRLLAVAATFFLIFFICGLSLFLVGSSISTLIEGASTYKVKIMAFSNQIFDQLENVGIITNMENLKQQISSVQAFSFARSFTSGVLSFLSNTVLIAVFLIFLFVSRTKTATENKLIAEIQDKISRYVLVKLLTSLGTGVIVGIVLKAFGVELAFMFAVLTVLLNFIPSIGSIIATILPAPILLLEFGLSFEFFAILCCLGAVQFTIGNIIEPKVMGENMDLHPVTVLAFLIFWGLVWGLPGMFLAVPITAVVKIVFSRIKTTKPVAEILAGRIPNSFR